MSEVKKNIKNIEDDLILAYDNFKIDKNKKTNTNLFVSLQSMCRVVLISNNWHKTKKNLDINSSSYECAVFLFEKLLTGRWVPEPKTLKSDKTDRFPWYKYISLCIRNYVDDRSSIFSNSLFVDMDLYSTIVQNTEGYCEKFVDSLHLEDNRQKYDPFNFLNIKNIGQKIHKSLLLFYSQDEINRLYPLSISYINTNSVDKAKTEVKQFCKILILLSKRIVSHNSSKRGFNIYDDIENILKTSIKSTVFIASILSNEKIFDKTLLMSLDIESLYRLCMVKGGETIRIPTIAELETLIGATMTVVENLTTYQGCKNIKRTIKKQTQLKYANYINFDNIVSNILNNIGDLGDRSTSPLMTNLLNAISELSVQIENLNVKTKELNGSEVLQQMTRNQKCLNMLNNSFRNITKIAKLNINR